MHILAVDDCQTNQFLSEVLIEKFLPNSNIHQVYDGLEAMDWLKTSGIEPDVILLDINMPRMDGHEFLDKFSKERTECSSIVVMLTSSEREDDRKRAMTYDFVKDYILKPLSQESVQRIAKAIES